METDDNVPEDGAVARPFTNTVAATEGNGAVARPFTDTVAATEGSQQQGRQLNTSTHDGAVARPFKGTVAAKEGSQPQGRQLTTTSTPDRAVVGPSTNTVDVAEGSQQQGRQLNTSTQDGAVARPFTDTVAATEGSQQQGRQLTTSTPDGAVARPFTNTAAATEGSQQQGRQLTTTSTKDGAVARPFTDTAAATEGSQQQGRQLNTSTQDGAVARPFTDTVAATEGSQQQGRQLTTTSTPDGAVARPFTDTVAATEGSQQQGRHLSTTSTPDGAVVRPFTDTVAATEGSQQQGRQLNTSTPDGTVARPFTDTVAATEGSQQQGRQLNTSTQDGAVARPFTDTVAATEGSQQQGRQLTTTSTPDGAVARPFTDTVAATEGSQQQGRQLNTSTPDGTVARPFTDTVAATEGSQQQVAQSISTTTHNYFASTVSHYDLSNSSNVAMEDGRHQGCISQECLSVRINQLSDMFVETHALDKAKELLKRHNHVAICGAPGDGKTSAALRICEAYMKKKYQVLFVESIEEFDRDVVIKRKCDMLLVFDDVFGSVAFPSSLEKLHKMFNALVDVLLHFTRDKELKAKEKQPQKKINKRRKKEDEKQCEDEKTLVCNYKLRFIFTSRSYNWNEGCARLHQFKVNLFKPEAIVDMIKTCLTTEEKKHILTLFRKCQMCDISNKDMKTITQLQDSRFGFPLICKLYCTNPAFQMHNIIDFFQNPVTYLRGDLDTIVREGSSRSAALVLLVLCGGKLNLASFKGKEKNLTELFQAVKEDVVSCTRTDIGREISNCTGTYCTVENHVASFSHPSIYDAAACALGNLNEDLLLEHCSLQFLYERVRLNKADHQQTTHTDDVTNMIYITSSLHPLVISRLVEGVQEGCFRWTVGHPVFSSAQIVSGFLTQMTADLPDVVHRKDRNSGECFLYWVSLSTYHSLFEHTLSLMSREGSLSHSVLADFYESIIGCTKHGNLRHLQHIAAVLKQHGKYDVDMRTKGERTPLMIAAEAGQLGVFNFLLQEGADVSATDEDRYNCLHLSCKSGSKDIVNVIIEKFQHLINDRSGEGNTPVMVCAESQQVEIIKFLVSHKADLTLRNYFKVNAFHIASSNGHVSVVEYLLTCEHITIEMRGGWRHQTAVMMAAEGGHYDAYNLLVLEGADLSLIDRDNMDCLMLACKGGNSAMVNHLLSLKTFNINRRGWWQQTAVMIAAGRGDNDVYNLLVLEGADLSLTDEDNRDCLMLGCKGGNVSIVKQLLSLKTFDINRRDRSRKQTAVMMAADKGHIDVYNLLVLEGADLSLADEDNMDCLMLACEGGNVSIVKHLLSLKTFDINSRGRLSKQTAVMMAAGGGLYDVYNLLVLEGADLSLAYEDNMDCLMLACKSGNVSIVKHLLSLNTFDINRRRGLRKQTAVMMAAGRGDYDVYNLLLLEGADLSLTNEDNMDCLMLACEGRNVSIVKHLLSLKTFDINSRGGWSKQTAVMMAAGSGHIDVYNLLVLEGADLSLTNEDNMDCLMLACEGGNVSILKHLLSLKTFDINSRGRWSKQTAVMMAAGSGHYDVYNLLVLEGADLSLSDEVNRDCLMLACEGRNVSIVKHLLSLKTFDINRRWGSRGQTAVMMAAGRGHYEVYNLLVLEGADLSLSDRRNRDGLMFACEGGNVSIVKHLLSLKTFDINRRWGSRGQTAVMLAAERGYHDVYNLLVMEGADLSLADEYNRDCLMLACKEGNVSIVKHLLSLKTFDINRRGGSQKQTAVMMAAEKRHYGVYNLLVLEGADLSLTDEDNRDCLMLACKRGNVYIVKHLLSLKTFDINRRGGSRKQTAVMIAAERGHYDVYDLLVLEGADLTLTDEDNIDCLMLACDGGNVSIVKHLLSLKTFDINRRWGSQKLTTVMMAAEGGHYDVYDLLVLEGADLSLTDEDNMDCLMLACEGGNVSIVKHLLSLKTFDINRRGGLWNQTAVMLATEGGHYDVYDLLVLEGADLSLTDEDNMDCLMLACEGGNVSIVKHLLSLKTFDINRRGGLWNQTAVMMAAEKGHYGVYNLLVLEGADLSLTDEDNRDCLMLACEGGNVSIVKHLLSLKTFNINRRGGLSNQTAVMMAAEKGHYGVYNLLVLEGADLSLTDEDNRDCLMLACDGGNVSIVKHLLSLKTFDMNRRGGSQKQTAVMVAAAKRHYGVYNLLVMEGADLSLTDEDNRDCLMLACEGGNVSIVKHLLSLKTFDINRRGGSQKQAAVMRAAEGGHYGVYNLLVLEGADLSLTDEDNRDCLMLACEGGNVSIVKHLLSLKTFDINRRGGSQKQTAVMIAAEKGHYGVYNLLVLEGADLSLTDEDNRGCLNLACERDNVYIVKHLLSLKTFDINRRWGLWNQTAVMVAAESVYSDVYNLLVLEGADLSLTDECNRDCLMLACDGGNVPIVKHLLSLKTFDINRRGGSQKQTTVMMAAESGHSYVYNLLVLEGADLSLTDEYNMDCLMLACKGGNVSIVKHLLSLKIFDINRRWGLSNQTAVMRAAQSGHSDVYNLLVLEGADLSLTDECNRDGLMLACDGGNVSIVKHLLSLKTFDINRRGGSQKQTTVMMAAESGHSYVYNLLVLEGADLSLTDEYNMDCLMLACKGGNVSIVKHLLSLKTFDVNRRGWGQQTAGMRAAERGHYDVYNLLVLDGADLSLTDEDNRDILMLACDGGNVSIVKHLLSLKTFDINRRGGSQKQTAVMRAAESGHSYVYNLLVLEGADLSLTDEYNMDCLMLACKGGNVSIVKHLLSLKIFDINRRWGLSNQTAVMRAAQSGHSDVYNLLVLEGADLSLTDECNRDCLMLACDGGNVSIVKHLLSLKTFDINRRGGSQKQTTVMMAAEKGHSYVYNLLVLEGADLSLTDEYNMDCLMLACKGGNMSIVKHLLSLKTFDVNRRGWGQQTAVMRAAERGHYDVYNLLVLDGADLSLTDEDNRDILMLACDGGNVSIVKHLLSLKTFDVNRRGWGQQTAVMRAAQRGLFDIYNLLVLEGADLSLTDECNRDCLMLACTRGNVSIVKHLLSLKTFDINRRGGSQKQTAVMRAAERGLYDIYNLLVLEGADLSLTDECNRDCLMLACKRGNVSIVKHLLSLKTFDINRRGGSQKQTAVMRAAERGHSDIYNLLVLEGADLSLTDECNRDCLMLACKRGNVSIVKHLLSLKTFDINRRGGSQKQTAVMRAAERGHSDIYNLLVLEGADLSLPDECNMDCLMLACKRGNVSIVKHLLSLKTFDINRRGGSRKQTAVMIAAERGHSDVYDLLVLEGADLSLTDEDNNECGHVREAACP
ncbi:uncharacterized protein LOC125374880 [Haliotis rufescens]|uniref:uncharacterized protein LOC125374880 n=1 Tax=Haliotis rufescens TaxID=6454 RepID=UPI00201EB99A|nr:uncharacterized protein LOC125374880 [Haliotis rufescens]